MPATQSKITWDPYAGATGYNVYRATEADPENFVLTETNIPVSVLDIDCEYVKVTAIIPSGETPLDCTPIHFCYTPPPVELVCVDYFLQNYAGSTIDLAWTAYPGATGYNVYIAEEATPETFILAYSNIAQTTITLNCQYAIVTAITPDGETPQCTPVHFCQSIQDPYAYFKADDAPVSSSGTHYAVEEMAHGNVLEFYSSADLPVASGKVDGGWNMVNTTSWRNHDATFFDIFKSDFTVRLWIYVNLNAPNDYNYWIIDNTNFYLEYDVSGAPLAFKFTWFGDLGDYELISQPITSSGWHRLIFWHKDGVEGGIKLDNETSITLPITETIAWSGGTFKIQQPHSYDGDGRDAIIDELKIWKNYVLTEADMTVDWNLLH